MESTLDEAQPTVGRSGFWSAGRVSWIGFGLALAVYLLSTPTIPRSDALFLVNRVENGPNPYYNFLYVPAGWLFHRGLRPILGWDVYEALVAFSSLCAALSVPLLMRTLRRFGISARASLAWGLVFAFTPAVWVFAVSVEVHTLQLLGAAIAIDLAVAARCQPSNRAFWLVVAGLMAAGTCHITAVALAPLVLALAHGSEAGRGLDLPGVLRSRTTWIVGVIAAAAGWFAWQGGSTSSGDRWGNPLDAVWRFTSTFFERLADGVFFRADEMLSFLRDEVLFPMGLLGPLLLLAIFTSRQRKLWVWATIASAPYFLLILQGGIREHGAYYLPLFATLVLYIADSWHTGAIGRAAKPALVGLALLVGAGQLVWAGEGLARARSGEDARQWIGRVEAVCAKQSVLFTDTLPKTQSAAGSYKSFDLGFQFTLLPRAKWPRLVNTWTSLVADELLAGRRVYIDASISDPERQAPFAEVLMAKILGLPVELIEVRDESGALLCHEVVPDLDRLPNE